jgi:hypothetical protein
MRELVPDSIDPVVGWRVWDVVELGGSLRLCSLAFWSIWLPGRAVEATCRRSLVETGLAGLPPHAAPAPRCTCGVYGTLNATQTLAYSHGVRRRGDTTHRVVGRVSLWGAVVECEGGWRASHAYPAVLYVPAVRRRRLSGRALARPTLPVEEIALELSDYGVPVELVDASSARELLALLEPRPGTRT